MAVSTSNAFSGPYTANGSTTTFPFTFSVMATTDVAVLLRDADGVDTIVSTSDYTVSLTGDVPSAGSVVFGTAPATGNEVFVYLEPAFDQPASFSDGSAWKAAAVNNINDRAALRDQALKRDSNRALKVPIDEEAPALASLADAEGMVLRVNGGRIEPWDASSFASDVLAAAQAQIDADLAAASTLATAATNAVGAVKQIVSVGLQPDAGIVEGSWYADFFRSTTTEFTLIRYWIYLGTGTLNLYVNVDGSNVLGPYAVTTTSQSDVIALTVNQGSSIAIQIEDVTGSPGGLSVQLEGLPA